MAVQRQTASEQYLCLSQGQAKRPAQLVAMQWRHWVKVKKKIATAKARQNARPSLWHYIAKTMIYSYMEVALITL